MRRWLPWLLMYYKVHSPLPSDCHVKYGLHSVVKTVWTLLADAVLMRSMGRTAARIASILA